MTRVWAIFKKEFGGYFNSLIAYVFLFVFLVMVNMLFIWFSFFQNGLTSMNDYFAFFKPALWLFIPAITMGAWAEEKKLGTIELIMTMPVRDLEAVLGKFLAAAAFFVVVLLLSMASAAAAVSWAGDLDWGPVMGGYLGMFLLGLTLISIGLAVSSMTEHQFVAFIVASIVSLLLMGLAEIGMVAPLPGWASSFLVWLDAGDHATSFAQGLVDFRDVLYYVSAVGLFLFLNYRAVSSRRWK